MSESDELLELNRLNKKITEHDMVSAMFISVANTSYIIDKFSMWLFAGTGATGALLITQINSVLSSMSIAGFKACMFMLVVSSIFAFVAKFFSLNCQMENEMTAMINEKTKPIFEKHEENEEKIEKYAKERAMKLETDINMNNVLKEYMRPFPKWMQWIIKHQAQKTEGDMLAAYHSMVQAYYKQSIFTVLQAVMFIGFMCSGWYYAGSSMQ